ncbi:MAG: hypothetical protein LM558_03135 [Thermosphaera sp.]|nr:hypothetical protein [Thermosphaera sp.]
MIRVKVIDLPKEGLTAGKLEELVNEFIEAEKPDEIVSLQFDPEFGLLIIVYKKGGCA